MPHICEKQNEGFFDFVGEIDEVTRIADKAAHGPAGSGWRCLVHYGQIIAAKQFQRYDYGSKSENKKHYGQETPPLYDLSKIEVPMALATGTVDKLADKQDIQWLLDES